jgi:hypothetical protein
MSEWRERANRRRDQRQTRLPMIKPPSGSGKDTKRWCRGKVGRKHRPVCVDYSDLKKMQVRAGWKVLVCEACGRHLDYYWPSAFRPHSPPPPWVT